MFIVVTCAAVLAFNGHWPPRFVAMIEAVLGSAAVILFFVAFPQVAYKSAERSLTVHQTGVETTIRRRTGSVTWDEVAQIEDAGQFIYIVRRNGNAFTIPGRAFDSDRQRADFLASILTRHQAARNYLASYGERTRD
jgi:hypothetical protein